MIMYYFKLWLLNFTPRIQRSIIGGGSSVANAAWNSEKGQPVSLADFYFMA